MVEYTHMGNNPVRASQVERIKDPAQDTGAATQKIKKVYEDFLTTLTSARKDHREQIDAVLKTIDERKIRELKEKLKEI